MKKVTQKDKIKIDKQLRKENYRQGGHTVVVCAWDPVTVVVKGHDVHFPSGSRLPIPEEWWV